MAIFGKPDSSILNKILNYKLKINMSSTNERERTNMVFFFYRNERSSTIHLKNKLIFLSSTMKQIHIYSDVYNLRCKNIRGFTENSINSEILNIFDRAAIGTHPGKNLFLFS